MLWLALHLPALPLQIFTRGLADPSIPIGVIDASRRTRILAVNPAARTIGVFAGQALSAAQAIAPNLRVQARQTERETALLAEVACWAGRFTPRISLAPPDAVLLEISGSLRLFGSLGIIEQQAQDGLALLGIQARTACAPTPLAASWFARCGQASAAGTDWLATLDDLPLSILDHTEAPSASASLSSALELLDGLGARSIGAVRALPSAGLSHRRGQAVTLLIARARGEQADPRTWFEPPARFAHELALPEPTDHSEALLFAARRLFASLAAWLHARHAAIDHCSLLLIHESQSPTTLELVLGHPANDESHLALIARERLTTYALPGEVCALRLEAEHPLTHGQLTEDLFGAAGQDRNDAIRLLDRLRARLGKDAVRRLSTVSDHRPELAWQTLDASAPLPRAPLDKDKALSFPERRRPVWLLPEPQPISPQQFALLSDAERIESGWWDNSDIRRDYYLAQHKDHSLCWIFHQLDPPGGWYLQGYFA